MYATVKIKANIFVDVLRNYSAEINSLLLSFSECGETNHIFFFQIHFITLNSSRLKKSIIAHCIVWQTRLGELLRSITEGDIDVLYAYVEKSSEEAMRVCENLVTYNTYPFYLVPGLKILMDVRRRGADDRVYQTLTD